MSTIEPPISKDDIGRRFRCRDDSVETVLEITGRPTHPVKSIDAEGLVTYRSAQGWFIDGDLGNKYDFVERLPFEPTP
jgi:hypothetical protein